MNSKLLSTAVSVAMVSVLFVASPLFSADVPAGKAESASRSNSWQIGFASNGERIYYTATSDSGLVIRTSGIRSPSGKKIHGPIACVSCHSPDGKGGKQLVNVGSGIMQKMDARDIRWSVLKERYDPASFNVSIKKGRFPDGTAFRPEMPRYRISDQDLADLLLFLQKLP
jgi:cytochrome c oxidase subunit II